MFIMFISLIIKVVGTYESSVRSSGTTRRYIPEDYINFILAAVKI